MDSILERCFLSYEMISFSYQIFLLVQSAYEKAKEVIEKERFIRMTARSASAFFEALENPPKPTSRLRKAAKMYKASENAIEN
jgi:uncharacterized protein (DUF1778 family)